MLSIPEGGIRIRNSAIPTVQLYRLSCRYPICYIEIGKCQPPNTGCTSTVYCKEYTPFLTVSDGLWWSLVVSTKSTYYPTSSLPQLSVRTSCELYRAALGAAPAPLVNYL